jgi:archaellum component FlaF (FlaF/FlaG flagellin family)
LNPAYVSAFAALAGAIIGGLTSFATSWFTQRAQLQSAGRQAQRAKLEALYNEFISLAATLYVDALTHQTEDLAKMVPLYALGSRMRLVSARAVTAAAERIDDNILATYLAPNRTLQEVRDMARQSEIKTLMVAFSEACREDLAGQAR